MISPHRLLHILHTHYIHTNIYSKHQKTKFKIYKECFEKGVLEVGPMLKKLPKRKSQKNIQLILKIYKSKVKNVHTKKDNTTRYLKMSLNFA